MYIQYYRLAERPRQCELDGLGVCAIGLNWQTPTLQEGIGVMAMSTGEIRRPKAGEWYLVSGGELKAWRAPHDITHSYLIVRLVIVRTKTTTTTIRISE